MAINNIIEITYLLVSLMLVNNLVLTEGLGMQALTSYGKANPLAIGFLSAIAMITVNMLLFPLEKYIIFPLGLQYLEIFILVILVFSISKLIEAVVKALGAKVYSRLNCDFRIIAGNSAVLGLALTLYKEKMELLDLALVSIGAGVGFIIAIALFASARKIIDKSVFIPEAFRGVPIQLVAIAIISLVFIGFGKVVSSLLTGIGTV